MSSIDYKADNIKLEIDTDAPIGRMYIDRAAKLNAITMEMRRDLVRFFDSSRVTTASAWWYCAARVARDSARAVIFRSSWRIPVPQLANLAYSMSSPERCTKPVIAVIDGHCYGGGLELALSCDFRFATPAARSAFPEITLGALPGSGGTQRAVRLMGVGRARAMVMTGRPISAEQAERWGLVTWLVEPNKLDQEVNSLAHHLCGLSPIALSFAKSVVTHAPDVSLAGGFQMEGRAMTVLVGMNDFQEGVTAWKEKRPAQFKGK